MTRPISADAVRDVRRMMNSGLSRVAASRATGIPYSSIKRLARGETYRDIK